MGRAKTDTAASDAVILQASLPETPVQHALQRGAGAASEIESPDLLPEAVADAYEVPSWAEFRTFVEQNGDKYVRASYPSAPADLIDTIWCGVPVEEHEQARVMTPKSEWVVY